MTAMAILVSCARDKEFVYRLAEGASLEGMEFHRVLIVQTAPQVAKFCNSVGPGS